MSDPTTWDVFESESLTVRRAQSQANIKQALVAAELTEDDLARPAGTSMPWKRLGDVVSEWNQSGVEVTSQDVVAPSQSQAPTAEAISTLGDDQELVNPDIEIDMDSSGEVVASDEPTPQPLSYKKDTTEKAASAKALSWLSETDSSEELLEIEPPEAKSASVPEAISFESEVDDDKWLEPSVQLEPDDLSRNDLGSFTAAGHEDEQEEEFTLSRSSAEKVEELDLAAMVDVAFQLVLFFMVTASVTLIKTMDLPKPTESTKPAAASAPGVGTKSKTDVETEFIVVAITADGDISVDDEPATVDQLVESLRAARTTSGKTGMLLRAENKTKHRTAVAAYDAANAIGLRIAIERETSE